MIPEKAKQKSRTKTERQEPAINPHLVAQGRTRARVSSEVETISLGTTRFSGEILEKYDSFKVEGQ